MPAYSRLWPSAYGPGRSCSIWSACQTKRHCAPCTKDCVGNPMSPGVAVNLALLGGVAAWVAWRAWPPTEAVRLRNALLVDAGERSDFDWTPEAPPQGFRVERRAADAFFVNVVRSIGAEGPGDDWTRALTIASHLVERAQDTGPVRADLHTTYDALRTGRGYCADFVKVYIALAHAAGLAVRQWGFSFDGFGGYGHTVAEVFDRQRAKWLLVDVHNNFHVVDQASGEPLGALEYRDTLLGLRDGARIVANGPGRPGFEHEATALEYYRRGLDQWYLLWGNAVYSDYGHPVVRALGRYSRTAAQVAANLVRVQPRLRILG